MLLESENIKLRVLEPEDADIIYAWENNPENWQVSHTQIPFSKYTIEQYVNSIQDIYSTKQLRFIICKKNENNKPIGCIDLFDFEPFHNRAGVGILIANKEERGKGYASQALSLLKEYAFKTLCLTQLFCDVAVSNEKSFELFTNNGFVVVGIKKAWHRVPNGYEDVYFMQALNYNA
ncbi:MAG: GNAT family N-acetyltransferase [Bacteroidia bacterium]